MNATVLRAIRLPILFILVLIGLGGCREADPALTLASRPDMLVANNWRLVRITDPNGSVIATNRLGVSALALDFIDIQFTDRNVARAIDRSSKQILNGGTWMFVQENQALDISVRGFVGIFPILELSRTKLIIKQNTTIDGKKTDVNLEFEPTV